MTSEQLKTSISEIAGRAVDSQGKEVAVYRALRPLLCARCCAEIKEGALFIRRKLGGIRFSPRCRECVPFELPDNTRSTSTLLESLLKPEPTLDKATKAAVSSGRSAIPIEVEQRLGHALARCRKRRR